MKVSLNTIKNLNNMYQMTEDVTKIGVDSLIEKIGGQLGAIDQVVRFGEPYGGVLIVKVVSCEKIEGADKLSLCKIDDGGMFKDVERDSDGHVQVVCGAPNVHTGQLAAWLPPGIVVPETAGKEPQKLEKREIRGVVSNGMLASPKELGLSDNHEGILDIEGDHKPGTDFTEAFGLKDDIVIDIENKMFTHRPDAFGILGIARELAGIQGLAFKSPDWYKSDAGIENGSNSLSLALHNELPDLVKRFSLIAISDVVVGPSPVWLQVELAKIGQKSINNIVDYTNYYMQETGQPLHAYDYDKVKALSGSEATIVVRNPKPGEKVKLLNGKEIEPRPESIMIATDKQLIGIGGVMGGSETEVDQNTRNIILEAASFDLYSIRRTSMAHGVFTDAATRFTKGQSPLQTVPVLNRISTEIQEHAGGKLNGRLLDDNHIDQSVKERNSLHPAVQVSADFINERLGLQLSKDEMKKILENVEFDIQISGDEMTIKAPFWRTDIELREDIVEEIGRLYGYDKLPLELPSRDLTPTKRDNTLDLKAKIRQELSKYGANEVLTYSFIPASLMQATGQDVSKAFEVANALSPDLQHYRVSLMPSLLDKVHLNIKAGYDEFALFEIGKTHSLDRVDDDGLPLEFEFTAFVVSAADKLKKTGAPYYTARKYLETLTKAELEYKPIGEDMLQYPVAQPYDRNRAALVSIKDGAFLGIIGEFKPSVTRALKLPKYTAGFEIENMALQDLLSQGSKYRPLSRFPKVVQDITLKVPDEKTFQEIFDIIKQELTDQAPKETETQAEPIDIFQSNKDQNHRNLTFRITITGKDRTLTDKEVNSVLDSIATSAKTKVNAERV